MRIYGNCWNQKSAGQYYRIRVPLAALQKLGLAITLQDDPFQDANERANALWKSDIQLHFLVAGRAIHAQSKAISELKPARDDMGILQYPPKLVFDVDDDIQRINPLNPKFSVLGTRDGNDELMMPRSELGIMLDDGTGVGDTDPLYLWRHNLDTPHGRFNAADNIVQHAHVRKMAATCDAITCTSERLKSTLLDWNKRIYVYPNSLLFDDFHSFDIRRDPSDVRVLWQGGYSHFPDFYPLRTAFKEAAQLMPQIKWVVFGTLFKWVYDMIAFPRVEFHPWVAFDLFHMKMGTLAYDINIAPLADTPFNQCKSGIKFYEAAALKIPTLAGNTGPYKDEIIDGETGLLFTEPREFVEKLEHLVKDVDFRRRIGNNAYDWVREHRDAMKTVVPLYGFYESLIKEVNAQKAA